MIWFWVILLIALAVVFIWPVLNKDAPVTARAAILRELQASKTQLAQIETEIASGFQDEDSAARAKRAMERRILYLGDKLSALDSRTPQPALSPVFRFGVPAVLVIGTLTLYPLLGAPGYSREAASPKTFQIPENLQNMSLPQLINELETRLSKVQKPDPVGYYLLARAKMSNRDVDGAIRAYEIALGASEEDQKIAAELAQAKAIKARIDAGGGSIAPKIDQDQIDAMNALTPEQRAAQINSMIDGLAARLKDEPDDLQGWLRLIRARTVQGKIDQARKDLATAKETFKNDEAAMKALSDIEKQLPPSEQK